MSGVYEKACYIVIFLHGSLLLYQNKKCQCRGGLSADEKFLSNLKQKILIDALRYPREICSLLAF